MQVLPLQRDDHRWYVCICIHGAVPDLLRMLLRFVAGTQRGAEDMGACWRRSVCLAVTHRGCTLGKTVVCRDFSIFWFHWGRGCAGGRRRALLPGTAGRLSPQPEPGSSHLLPRDAWQGRYKRRFIPRLVLPICKIDV